MTIHGSNYVSEPLPVHALAIRDVFCRLQGQEADTRSTPTSSSLALLLVSSVESMIS